MKTSSKALLVCCGVFLLGILGTMPYAAGQQPTMIETRVLPEDERVAMPSQLPDSPGATLAHKQRGAAPQNAFAHEQFPVVAMGRQEEPAPVSSTEATPSVPASGSKVVPQKPVGTAAAEAVPASGVAASEPAGVAIAPAKQHRVRTIVLRMGAIVGAGVAVGSVVALTQATPSKPPGAH